MDMNKLIATYTVWSKRRRKLKKSDRWNVDDFNAELTTCNFWYLQVEAEDPVSEEARDFIAHWRAMLALDKVEGEGKVDPNQLPLL